MKSKFIIIIFDLYLLIINNYIVVFIKIIKCHMSSCVVDMLYI